MAHAELGSGDLAPDFALRSHTGEEWKLSKALEQGPVVLFFYPKDDTPVCIVEACGFRDMHAAFLGHGAQVVGVSRDSVASHESFARRYELPFTLLSDPDGKLRQLFGVKKTLGFMDGRVTFVIDKDRRIRHMFRSALNAKAHVEQALATLRSLQASA
jgi:thioredoxin-dependent peroxiredoxin